MTGSSPSTTAPPSPSPWPARLRSLGFALALVAGLGLIVALVRPRPTADAVWNDAKVAFEARDFPRADALMGQLAPLRPPRPEDDMLRAQVAMGMDRNDEAFAALAKVPDDFRMAAVARLQMGQMERARDRFDSAEHYLREAIRLDPAQIKARRELIYILGIELRRDDLDALFRELAQRSELDFSEVFLWCLSKGLTWDAEENNKTLRKVVDAEPANRWARLGMAGCLFDLSRFDQAEATLAPLPDSDPDARALRVRIALARGDDTTAEALLDDGPARHLGLALLRGQMALARGDAAGALRNYRIARECGPLVREAIAGLAKALRLNRDPEAAAALEEARRLDVLQGLVDRAAQPGGRNDRDLIRDLGAACAAVDRPAEARAWYQLAVAADPFDTRAQSALGRLQAASPAPAAATPR